MSFDRSSLSSSLLNTENSRAKFNFFYLFIFFIILFVTTTFITSSSLSSPYIRNSDPEKLGNFYPQEEIKKKSTNTTEIKKKVRKMGDRSTEEQLRRYLRRMGSSPPRCSSKCGRCTPCRPVHVPVPPGTPVTAEYYPEAWRCKCGNKLYIP